jgi:hypothetical protein
LNRHKSPKVHMKTIMFLKKSWSWRYGCERCAKDVWCVFGCFCWPF